MTEEQHVNQEHYNYDAFISYRHVEPDITVAKKLHRLLESYRIPTSIVKNKGIKKLKRVFRDQEELPTSGNLSQDIQNALQDSRYLIVVCSPNTPKSKWCSQEIDIFRKLHGNDRILSILIQGEPNELRNLIPLFASFAMAVGFYWRWGENPNMINALGFVFQAIFIYFLFIY